MPPASRLIFMGTPAFAMPALEALIASPHRVVAVYTQPPRPAGKRGLKETPSPVQVLAERHGIPIYTPTSLKSPEAQAQFEAHQADAAIIAAYGLLLPKPILAACPLGCINIHPSLLPRWRGAAPIQRTLMAGDTKTGICIIQMDEGLDTGSVLLREECAVPESMNAGELHNELARQSATMLLRALKKLEDKTLTPEPQSAGGVTYAKKITKDDCRLDWSQPAEHLHNQIRGLSPSPGAYFEYGGEIIKLFASTVDPAAHAAAPGTVLDDSFTVACGTHALRIEEAQRLGKKRMPAAEFLKGFPLPRGALLVS